MLSIVHSQMFGLSDAHCVAINELSTHSLVQEAKDAYLEMKHEASLSGIRIEICSSFRSFDRQLLIWNKKWKGETAILDSESKPLHTSALSDLEKVHAIMRWSALPGASRHHWGSDFDVFDPTFFEQSSAKLQLVPKEYESGGPCFELTQWMTKHAHKYGFSRPYSIYSGGVSPEPWHFSYTEAAEKIIQQFDVKGLYNVLRGAQILGKETILSILPDLFARYTLNLGQR